MLGVLVNAAAIMVGALLGVLFKKGIPERFTNAIMSAIGLCVLVIGGTGVLKGENLLVMIVSMVLGTALGTWIDIDQKLNALGKWVERRFNQGDSSGSVAQGFVTGSLLFCVGAMAIVGSLESGLSGNHTTLFTKALLDGISSVMLAVSLGVGVLLSAAPVFLYQGAIVLLAQVLQPLLSDTIIAEMTCVGSLMIVALAFNMLGITKIKVANLLPAIVIAPFVSVLFTALGIG